MRINVTITVTAAGAVNVISGLNATTAAGAAPSLFPRTMARALLIQMVHGGTGRGYVMDGIYGVQPAALTSPRIPSAAVASDVTAELAPAAATVPGGTYSDSYVLPNGAGGIDISKLWVDGSVPGDLIKVSYDTIG